MKHQKPKSPSKPVKKELHPRNRHTGSYDFEALIAAHPVLSDYVKPNKYGNDSVNFFDPQAVLALNTALLKSFYGVTYWSIPEGYLCPPIPGRADYVHYAADLLALLADGDIPKGADIKCLDIGIGANCIYPIIGHYEYGWSFVGTDIHDDAIASANDIITKNPKLKNLIELRLQTDKSKVLTNIIKEDEYYDIVICNPPFHSSAAEAERGSRRKVENLTKSKQVDPVLNFGGQHHELWCEGGEREFIKTYIAESANYKTQCLIYTTLLSKEAHLETVVHQIKKHKDARYEVSKMGQGNKQSHIISWSFLSDKQVKTWVDARWKNK